MRSIFKKISNNLDLTFFYLSILSIPLGTKLVFLSKDSYFIGAFVHYTTFFLYLSDIFFILALFFWILKQIRRRYVDVSLSNSRENSIKSEISNNKYKALSKQNIIYYILFFFLICAVLSIFLAKNNLIGIYQALKLFEFVLLFILAGKFINSLKKLYLSSSYPQVLYRQ
jgi:hypothetical protein